MQSVLGDVEAHEIYQKTTKPSISALRFVTTPVKKPSSKKVLDKVINTESQFLKITLYRSRQRKLKMLKPRRRRPTKRTSKKSMQTL
jgi:hypothetical protein